MPDLLSAAEAPSSGGSRAGLTDVFAGLVQPHGRGRFAPLIQRAELKYGIPTGMLDALIGRESNYDPAARSKAGAVGLGQLRPEIARGLGVDPNDPAQNIDGSARHLSQLLRQFKNPGRALAAYKVGAEAVQPYKGVPPFPDLLAYVNSIQKNAPNARAISGHTRKMQAASHPAPKVVNVTGQKPQASSRFNEYGEPGGPTSRPKTERPGVIDSSGVASQHDWNARDPEFEKAMRRLADEDPQVVRDRLARQYRAGGVDPIYAPYLISSVLRERDRTLSSKDHTFLQKLYDPKDWAVTPAAVPTPRDINIAVESIKNKIRNEGHTPAVRAALWAIGQLGSPRWAAGAQTDLPDNWRPLTTAADKCAPFVCDAYREGARVKMSSGNAGIGELLHGGQAYTTNEYADPRNKIEHAKVVGVYDNARLRSGSINADPGTMIFFEEPGGIGHSVMSLGGQLVVNWGTTHRGKAANIALATIRGAVAGHPRGTFRIWTDK